MSDILVICGTRPEAIKLFPVIAALRSTPGMVVRTCVTGQHRDLVLPILALADIRPDAVLDVMTPGQPLDALVGRLMTGIGSVIDRLPVDRVLVQGDTASALAGALAAYHRRCPVAHVEAGLRSGDRLRPWPEEGYRCMIAPLADLHFAPTAIAAAALASEGITQGVHVTGNTVIDALHHAAARRSQDTDPADPFEQVFARMTGRRLVLVTTHRRETWTDSAAPLAAIEAIAERPDVVILWPLHPAIRPRVVDRVAGNGRIVCVEPLPYPTFVRALHRCDLVLTDSGGVQEEAPSLGKPVLVMRDTTERPEAIAAGAALLVGTDPAGIARETLALLDDATRYMAMAVPRPLYGDGHAAQRIAAILAGGVPPVGGCGGTGSFASVGDAAYGPRPL